jgi:hypothetical protein
MKIQPDSELARAYRATRRYHSESGAPGPHRRPAHLALKEARLRLARVAELVAAYEAAETRRESADAAAAMAPGAMSWAEHLQSLTTAAHKARTAKVDAMARAGQFHHGPEGWRIWPPAPCDDDGTAFYLTRTDGYGAVRDVVDADSIMPRAGRYYDNPHGESWRDGSGLMWGVVARLSHGRALAGWQHGGTDGGPTLSAKIFSGPDAAEDAAYYADGMAERAAEREREYQEAWRAGDDWAEAGNRLLELRTEIRAWIAEMRPAQGLARTALCEGLKARLEERRELMEKREELAHEFDHCEGWPDGVAG